MLLQMARFHSFFYDWILFLMHIYHLFVTHSSGDELWSCSHILTTINNAAMDMSFPGHSDGKASAYNAGDLGSVSGSGRSPGEGDGYPLQCSCLENPMESPWQAAIHRVAQSWTQLKQLSTHTHAWTWGAVYLLKLVFLFSSDIDPGVELSDHMVVLVLVFWGTCMFSTVAAPLTRV